MYMPYLIDGHNLIAVTPGISLDDPDDEVRLIALIRTFCGRRGKRAIIYFDRAAPGAPDPSPAGGVVAHFVSPPRTADEAIRDHLARLGREARNWEVISSDREVREAASQAGSRLTNSQTFAKQLTGENLDPEDDREKPPSSLSNDEVEEWERLFLKREERDDLGS
jgi:predicted RNA-binding protein with PIN domain